ncbi:hypothetical protein HU200_065754 [Digitaria exilis]|uniref:Protein kinase domain-containing protein n=1 Tax=Digitaria exilis TaxID=1010633 RepID=A0A835DUC9_9POAL|nr:hypothetical protein HU200_065754 [Digitaria exilis]
MPGCQTRCGDVDIPFPFGVGVNCSLPGFEISCGVGAATTGPVLAGTDIAVLNLTVMPRPEARVLLPVAWQCFNSTGDSTGFSYGTVRFNPAGVYRISDTHNELFVLGCNTLVYTNSGPPGRLPYTFYTGCMTFCNDSGSAKDGRCAGVGCCHVDIPPGLTDNWMEFGSPSTWSHADQEFSPCDYGFIVEKGYYTFRASDLANMPVSQTMPLRLDWAIRNNGSSSSMSMSCAAAKKTSPVKILVVFPLAAQLALGITLGLSLLIVAILVTLMVIHKRRMNEYFKKNGGSVLKKVESIKIFTKDELNKITKNNSEVLGQGGFGKVYKGTLEDSSMVAVKSSIEVNEERKEDFTNEVTIQSQMIHRNILKLVGCCLEVDVPMLVYEFATKGSLQDILHGEDPVFMKTGLLTQKSDVYSFGAVLLELISRKKIVYGKNNSLIMDFCRVYEKEGSGRAMLDVDIATEENIFILDEIGKLAIDCLKDDVNDRPDMNEVAEQLVMLRRDRKYGKSQNKSPRHSEGIATSDSPRSFATDTTNSSATISLISSATPSRELPDL